MLNAAITEKAEEVLQVCREKGLMVATAESCTGGLIAGALTAIAGSSAVVERGFITYSNEAKNEILGVPLQLIEDHGAVSPEVATRMAEGALKNSPVDLTVAVTGIAGPDGGTPEKPVGTVQIASACAGKATISEVYLFDGDRDAVREKSVASAFEMMLRQAAS